jgi:hypothetical protein
LINGHVLDGCLSRKITAVHNHCIRREDAALRDAVEVARKFVLLPFLSPYLLSRVRSPP